MSVPMSTVKGPYFLMVPQERGDEAWERLSPAAFKIWYRVVRLTIGWCDKDEQGDWIRRDEAIISFADFRRADGLSSRNTIRDAIRELIDKGFLQVIAHKAETGEWSASTFTLQDTGGRSKYDPLPRILHLPQKGVGQNMTQGWVRNGPRGGSEIPLPKSSQPSPEQGPRDPLERVERKKEEEDIRLTSYAADAAVDTVDTFVDNSEEEDDAQEDLAGLAERLGAPDGRSPAAGPDETTPPPASDPPSPAESEEDQALLDEKREKEQDLIAQLAEPNLPRFQRRPLEFALHACRTSMAELEERLAHSHTHEATPGPRLHESPEQAPPAPEPEQASDEPEPMTYEEFQQSADDEPDEARAELPEVEWRKQLFGAICDLWQMDWHTLNKNERKRMNEAVLLLWQSKIFPDQFKQMPAIYRSIISNNGALTYMALANHASEIKPYLA